MARRRKYKKRKKSALDYIAFPQIDLDPDIKKGIFIILILIFGVISMLSLFDAAGSLGTYLSWGLMMIFGWGKWLFPLMLLILGFFMYNEDKYYIRGTNYLGLFLFIVSFQPLLHFFVDFGQWQDVIADGVGGGYVGYYLALGFHNVLGFWAGLIIIIGLLLIALMLMFDASLSMIIGGESIMARIFYPVKVLFLKIFGRREENEEDGDEDEEEEEEEEEEIEEEEEVDEEEEAFSQKEVAAEEVEEETSTDEDKSIWKSKHIKIDLPLDLLSSKVGKPTGGDIKNNSLIIQRTLENFGIMVEMGEISVGPTVTQYTFKPAEGVKLSRVTSLNNDLALALAAHPIRIEAPIPGRALVGIEVPNQTKAIVGLKAILEDKEFKNRKSSLSIALGKDVSGKGWLYDLPRMPHLLVAGATNSGKSVCLNSVIVSLLYQNNPDDLRFIMVDPKRVELPIYNGIPHLLTPVITDVNKTINALKWCLNEMDRRFEILSKSGKRNIQAYNVSPKTENMPYIVFIIDELADLMVAASKDIEGSVIRLAQMSRAVGIHLVLATQRPSVDVITGLIKANMPARIAFSVASGVDSKTILDSLGAEKLLGQGDMLFITAEISKPKRLQGAYVSDNEIKKIVNYIKEKGGSADYLEGITDRQKVHGIASVGLNGTRGDEDELFAEAKEVIVNMGKASASLLQRRLSIGYARAARILDELEEAGVVGPSNGSKPREIMISKEQYEGMINQGVSGASLHSKEESKAPDEYFEIDEDEEEEEVEDNPSTGSGQVEEEESALSEAEGEDEEIKEEVSDEKKGPEQNEDGTDEEKDESKEDKESEDEDDDGMYFAR